MTRPSTARRKPPPRTSSHTKGALPLPLAGEGWGEGVSARETSQEDRALTHSARDDVSYRP
ncbi:MAG: hypothetical protein EKK33_29480 [Bradyrhizobiaceae bacterium]|nr:MAG: hypothetical protein EKK33_29480 [Bradyrhizobiaceae bacterium]